MRGRCVDSLHRHNGTLDPHAQVVVCSRLCEDSKLSLPGGVELNTHTPLQLGPLTLPWCPLGPVVGAL